MTRAWANKSKWVAQFPGSCFALSPNLEAHHNLLQSDLSDSRRNMGLMDTDKFLTELTRVSCFSLSLDAKRRVP